MDLSPLFGRHTCLYRIQDMLCRLGHRSKHKHLIAHETHQYRFIQPVRGYQRLGASVSKPVLDVASNRKVKPRLEAAPTELNPM